MADVIPLPSALPTVMPPSVVSAGRMATRAEVDALAVSLVRLFSLQAAGWCGHSQADVIAKALATMITGQTEGHDPATRMTHANWAADLITQEIRRRAWQVIKTEVRHG